MPSHLDAARALRRAWAAAAVVARVHIERDSDARDEREALRLDTLRWLDAMGARDALSVEERAWVEAPVGDFPRDRHGEYWHRTQDVFVLAWALGLVELPAIDDSGAPEPVIPSLRYGRNDATERLDQVRLRPRDEIVRHAEMLDTIADRPRSSAFGPSDALVLGGSALDPGDSAAMEKAQRMVVHRTRALKDLIASLAA